MKPLIQADLIPYAEYEPRRETFRWRIIELKQRRRISVGEHVTLVFENRDTIQFQLQEMIRAERIVEPAKVQEELDVYNALLPGDGELSATLFIEIPESDRIKQILDAFKGIDFGKTVAITAGQHTTYAEFEGGHSNEEKISAVHFVKFRIPPAFLGALASTGTPVMLTVHHGAYHRQMPVPDAMRLEWLADLQPEKPSGSMAGRQPVRG